MNSRHGENARRGRDGYWSLGWIGLFIGLAASPSRGTTLDFLHITAEGQPRFSVTSDTNHYYVLQRSRAPDFSGARPVAIEAVDVALQVGGEDQRAPEVAGDHQTAAVDPVAAAPPASPARPAAAPLCRPARAGFFPTFP